MSDSQKTIPGESEPRKRITKYYLSYLEKEMTIMGLLTAFSVTVAGLTVKTAIKWDESIAWVVDPYLIIPGILFLLMAALVFYRQRSLLAFYYGQIALARARGTSADDLLNEADAWATWTLYRWAFAHLLLGILALVLALMGCVVARVVLAVTAIPSYFYVWQLTTLLETWKNPNRPPGCKQILRKSLKTISLVSNDER